MQYKFKGKKKLSKRGKLIILSFFVFILIIIGLFTIPSVFNKGRGNGYLIVSTDYYDMKVDWDKTGIKKLDRKVDEFIEEQKTEFLKIVEESKDIMSFKYDFILNAQTVEYKNIIFVNIMINNFTGGAHYNRIYETYVYDTESNKFLNINDILMGDESFRELSLVVKHELMKYSEEHDFDFNDEWLNDGANPSEENYHYFYLDEYGLTIIFPPYQVIYGAVGEIKINLTYDKINNLLKEEFRSSDVVDEDNGDLTPYVRDLTPYKDKKLVAFTFDDGPNTKTTSVLLDGMRELDAKATFFVLGNRVNYYKDVLRRMYVEGNQIGTHTQNHKNLKILSDDEIKYEIDNSKSEIKNILGVEPTLLRPPYGNINDHIKNQTLMHTIMWNVDSIDWKLKDRTLIKEEILKSVDDGDIVLLHDIYEESVEGALLAMRELKDNGYAFVTIDEMAKLKGIELDYTTSYFNF